MKQKTNFIFLLFLLLLPFAVFSQRAVAGLSKMNVLYIGLDNPVEVAISGIPDDKIVVAIEGGTITGEKGKYIVRPTDKLQIREAKIFISYRGKKDKVIPADTFIFRIKAVPLPTPFFGSKSDGSAISRKELMLTTHLTAQLENFPFEGLRYKTRSYTFHIVKENTIISFSDTGMIIPRMLRSKIREVKTGDKIVIDNITVSDWNGKIINLPRLELFVDYPSGTYNSLYLFGFSDKNIYFYSKNIYYKIENTYSKENEANIKKYYRHTNSSADLIKEELFKNNKLMEATEYYRNGKIYFQTQFQHPDSVVGYYKKYFPEGKIESEGYIKRDTVRRYIVYYEQSKVSDSLGYLQIMQPVEYIRLQDSIFGDFDFSFIRTGTWKFYFKNKKLKSTGEYINEIKEECGDLAIEPTYNNIVSRHGKWSFYKDNGKLEKEIIYEKGRIVSEKKY